MPLTTSREGSPAFCSAMTLTWNPSLCSVNASLRTRESAGKQFSTSMTTLPADAFIVLPVLHCVRIRRLDEVDHNVTVAHAREPFFDLGRPLSHENDVGIGYGVVQRLPHQPGNVRNGLIDVPKVRSMKPRQRDVFVVDRDVEPLADQHLDELGGRALAQVVRPDLEGQTEDRYALLPCLLDHPEGFFDLVPVALEDRPQNGRLEVQLFRPIQERPKILRQARSAECEAWL